MTRSGSAHVTKLSWSRTASTEMQALTSPLSDVFQENIQEKESVPLMHDNTRSEEGTVVILVKFVSQVVSSRCIMLW